ncbi:16S rRNA (guanine(527)-N(7))-methyltransferase RsmG [Tenuifilum thalassicum]|uniref:Ribosomal RNA small subunit methyltransferase G n=1 Tax=Tenuifilum thalassicum TaxID=2590900 RepID=A0A7D4BSY8_9BACT|nr:16S rRNA (guanine(527)-N(7))-methyltransferase RsmG [Tenuifilum thalassicum]QKG80781.1 16S rRNA (guanine(527)-N(7))-methyltransferase RsmG [Tenuifilum thalassicum]
MESILQYFPELTSVQRAQLAKLEELYKHWNAQINVISRKDIDNLMTHHVLHSLAIAKVINFAKGTRIMDIGTGGGFPGIPLAIFFPSCHFTLVDSIAKKTKVAMEVAKALELSNIDVVTSRAENLKEEWDFVVSRAVAPVSKLMAWTQKNIHEGGINNLPNGLICLKGGDIKEELKPYNKWATKWKIDDFFEDEYFAEKYVIHIAV